MYECIYLVLSTYRRTKCECGGIKSMKFQGTSWSLVKFHLHIYVCKMGVRTIHDYTSLLILKILRVSF